jgi:hypothetical protein
MFLKNLLEIFLGSGRSSGDLLSNAGRVMRTLWQISNDLGAPLGGDPPYVSLDVLISRIKIKNTRKKLPLSANKKQRELLGQ